MNCDKKFLGYLRLEVGGYVLSFCHTAGSLAALGLFINYYDSIDVQLWILIAVGVFWIFHLTASILLFIGTFRRKAALIIPFILLYTLIFTCIATFVAFCILEAIASQPRASKTASRASNSTLAMKRKMKEFKENFVPKMTLKGVDFLLLVISSSVVTICCVYILSCICSLYDSLKGTEKEQRSFRGTGSAVYGAVKESESDES